MKIALYCKSELLGRALVLFLKDYLVSVKHCDIIVSDVKLKTDIPVFLIANDNKKAHLQVPFSKETLLKSIEEFYLSIKNLRQRQKTMLAQQTNKNSIAESKQNDFEEKLDMVLSNFKKEIINLLKEYNVK